MELNESEVSEYVTGACSVAYGAGSIVEEGFDVGYGCLGDLNSKAFNPIRDTIFMGNQNAYNKWGNLNMTVAGLCIPVSQAVNGAAGTGQSLLMTAAKTAGKELAKDKAFDFVSSGLTGIATEKFGLNQTQAALLNIGLSIGLEKGADAAEARIKGRATFAEGMSYGYRIGQVSNDLREEFSKIISQK